MVKFRFFTLAALSCVLFSSCLKSSFYYSGYVTYANVVDAATLSGDGGVTYNVTENGSSKDFSGLDRIILNCDLLAAVNDDNIQDIKVNDFYSVPVLRAVSQLEQTVTESDAAEIMSRSWTSNTENGEIVQYFNMYVGYKGLKGNDTEHVFQLVFEPQTEKSNEYFFYLYHNAGEDKCAEDTPEENIEEKGGYISFRVEHIISGLTFDSSTKFWIYPASDKESGESSTEVSAAACRQGF